MRRLAVLVLFALLVASVAAAPNASAELPAPLTLMRYERVDPSAYQVATDGGTTELAAEAHLDGVAFRDVAHGLELWFAPPAGDQLALGLYEDARPAGGRSGGQPGFDITFGLGSCADGRARYSIAELELDANGSPARFSARFAHTCGAVETVGFVSYNARADVSSHRIFGAHLDFAFVPLGRSNDQTIDIASTGPSALTLTDVAIEGPQASEFRVVEGCAPSIPAGEQCVLRLRFTPTGDGTRHATLVLRDDYGPPGSRRTFAMVGGSGVLPPPPPPDPSGEFTPLIPARVLDTRTGLGHSGGQIGGEQAIEVALAGRGGVPVSGVAAVVVNVTVAAPTDASFLTVWPSGVDRPEISNLNYVAGQTVPNLVTVALGDGGRVSVFNERGDVHVLFDVVGYYADSSGRAGSRFSALRPQRVFDTRTGAGGVERRPVGPGEILQFSIGAVAPPGATAVALNMTVTRPTAAGYLTVAPGGVARPEASSLNFAAAQTVANLVIVRVPMDGVIEVFNEVGFTHVVADLVGWYHLPDDPRSASGRYVPVLPERIVDTRLVSPFPDGGAVPAGQAVVLGRLPTGSSAVALNVTAVAPTAVGYLTAFPMPPPAPLASNLNFGPGRNVPNHVLAPNDQQGVAVANSAGSTHVLVDIFGYFRA